ncbi:hypothetical protein BDW02DRAFT_554005 [Decorospora gaudefroyi]|uniref:CRIB domain-containing protein n=1 Tax=Decorospora gaudefroyi TaxID=184978 RepID=A0A6A5K517_9PLEO|nr:hypothetical protein BDW02DRAFT_554005 [Decorospora gaudefroyi]
MFSFHKSDASRSRQSSVDSEATGPTTPTAASDLWPDQCSMSPPHLGAHSPEQQQRVYAVRRSSVFNLRSRSNTATSMTPSLLSLSHSDMAEHDALQHGSPPGQRQAGSKSQKEATGSRRSLFRGKRGKRLSETTGTAVDEYEGDASEKRMSVLRRAKKGNQYQDAGNLISRISSPFDFQHLTHTDRHQLAALEHPSSDKLSAGFFAVHASQPHSRPDNLHFNNFSSENLASTDDRSASALSFRSPPHSPHARHESATAPHLPTSGRTLRLARSVDSFSQPAVSPRKHQTQPLTSPPLLSSRLPFGAALNSSDLLHESGAPIVRRTSRSKRESGIWESLSLSATTTPEILPGIEEGSSYFGHAFTTPDDSAIHAMTPPFSPSLADVAEEPERFVSPRPAPQPPSRAPTSPTSPYYGSFPFHGPQSSTNPITRGRGNSSSSGTSISRPASQLSDTLGSTHLTRRTSARQSAHRRQSNTWRAIEESWEEDVDYIYDNALEADCDFEWDRASNDGAESRGLPKARHAVYRESEASSASGQFRASLLVPCANSVPELVPTSAISTSTMSTGLPTPSDSFTANRFGGDVGFALSPSLLVPPEYKDTHEVTYEDLLDEYAGSDRHFPMLDARQSTSSSARSSHARLSRRSSYDSSLMSSAMWSSPVRRSASSAGSVPELVPSRRNRKEQGFSLGMDQLSLDESKEEDDITPPGTLEGRTFFAAEDEAPQDVEQSRLSIETELRTSLDLARRGSGRNAALGDDLKTSLELARQNSQRSTRHKQTLSESAAKRFSALSLPKEDQPMKPRGRSATTTQVRSPMLSLFPAPPRHTPTPTQM